MVLLNDSMVKLTIDKLDAPYSIEQGKIFDVKFKIKYLTWPWWLGGPMKSIFGNLYKDNKDYKRDRYNFKPWWFWGSKDFVFNVDGLYEVTKFKIEIGWSDE